MSADRLLKFKITAIKQENALAKTYELELLEKEVLQFKPGQFLTFIILTNQQEFRRSYSILSLPGEPLQITVKKVENGAISRFILDNWKIGQTVETLPPAGRFFIDPQQEKVRDIFCFAAGSGIVPILPQIRHLLKAESQSSIHLVYSNRKEKDSLFLEEIKGLTNIYPNFDLVQLFSDPETEFKNRGHLSNLNTEVLVLKLLKYCKADAVFLLCGPFSYMRMLIFTLGLMGFEKDNIKRENFIPEIMLSGTATTPMFPVRELIVRYRDQLKQITVNQGENILQAGLKAGLHIPYSCKGGVCGSCAARCKGGKVYMSINEVLTESDLQKGWVLTCTGFPETEGVELDFDAD